MVGRLRPPQIAAYRLAMRKQDKLDTLKGYVLPSGVFLTATLLVLAYPPFDIGLLGLVALVPWLRQLEGLTPRAAWRQGYWLGILFFGGTIWWLVHVTVVGTVALVAYLALYFAAFGAFVAWWCRTSVPGTNSEKGAWHHGCLAPLLASAWTLLEWGRGTVGSGLGWNLLAHTQWHSPLVQIADLSGVYGVSWLVVFINVLVWQVWSRRTWRLAVAVVATLGLVVGYGAWQQAVAERTIARGPVLDVALVQGNIPQDEKWDPDFVERIKTRYEQLTRQAAQAKPDLVIWPETAVPGLADDPDLAAWLKALALDLGVPLLVGAPAGSWEELTNSAILVDGEGRVVDRYDKLHLVPFGEFIPGEGWWPILGCVRQWLPIGQFIPGTRFTIFNPTPDTRYPSLSTLICFEDLFPELARTFVRSGAHALVTITNDAWFGRTAAPVQHAQASTFRAVEHRVWMLRAANTGLTCAIDPAGRMVATVRGERGRSLWVAGVAMVPVALGVMGPTLYTRLGDWWLGVCAALIFVGVMLRYRRER